MDVVVVFVPLKRNKEISRERSFPPLIPTQTPPFTDDLIEKPPPLSFSRRHLSSLIICFQSVSFIESINNLLNDNVPCERVLPCFKSRLIVDDGGVWVGRCEYRIKIHHYGTADPLFQLV
jgi:hypothetical protein